MTQTQRQRRLRIQREIMSYHVNPFHSDINPGIKKNLQLFLKATEPLKESEKIDLMSDKAKALIGHLTQVEGRFGWNKLISRVNVGTAMAPNYKNILKNGNSIKLEHIVAQAWSYFENGSNTQVPDNKGIVDIDLANNDSHKPIFSEGAVRNDRKISQGMPHEEGILSD